MRFTTAFQVLGVLLMFFSLTMLPPMFIGIAYEDAATYAFYLAFVLTFITGAICWFPCRNAKRELQTRDGFFIVVLFWVVLSLFGSLPFLLPEKVNMGFVDSLFESVSGLTTTGASVISGIEFLPQSLIYYRQQLQFLGGMGIVVLAVAILPMLRIGGLHLYKAEMPGPSKDSKITPRIAETAKALWYVYVGLTLMCAVAYWVSGMSIFNAIGESFATVSTGGFSMHDASFAYYDSISINAVGSFFMLLGGTNFTLHFFALRYHKFNVYWQDYEFRHFLKIILFSIVIISLILLVTHTYDHPTKAISNAVFNTISLATTTGLTSSFFNTWPIFIPILLMLLAIIGGCASSTSGGLKVIRVLLMVQQGIREIRRCLHPKAVFTIKIGRQNVKEEIMQSIWSFISVFVVLFLLFVFILMATGLNFTTSFSAIVASLANAGVGIGEVTYGFSGLSNTAKMTLVVAMIAGRLEIFTLLVLFSPRFWRK